MNIYNGAISIEKLLQAHKNLVEFVGAPTSPMSVTASIQAFEYTYELLWKTLRKILIIVYGLTDTPSTPRLVFQKAYELKLIDDLPFWLSTISYRNETLHTYENNIALEVYQFLPKFIGMVKPILEQLKKA